MLSTSIVTDTQAQPRSREERADLQCPSCGQPFATTVWLVVDRQERPDLVRRLMDGELNVAVCSHCGAEGGVNHPMLLHDAARQTVYCAVPLSVQGEGAAREMIGDLLRGLIATLPPAERQPYLAEVELVPELDGLRAALIQQALADDASVDDHLLAAAVGELLNSSGQSDFQRVIAEHRQLLLDDRAERALDDIARGARQTQDRELGRRAREARAILGRMRTIVVHRRRALAELLDGLAPLNEEQIAVIPYLQRMLDAVDPQEVYAARIALGDGQQTTLDGLVERLARAAEDARETEALAFIRNLQALPRQ